MNVKLKLEIEGQTIELSMEEARKLYDTLGKICGAPVVTTWPSIPNVGDCYPSYPPRPVYADSGSVTVKWAPDTVS